MSKTSHSKKSIKKNNSKNDSLFMSVKQYFPRKKEINKKLSPAKTKMTLLEYIKELAIVFGIFLVLNNFVIASMEVPTGSMENTVMTGDFLFVNKFIFGGTTPRTIPFTDIRLPWFRIPGLRDIKRGDPVVFEFPGNQFEIKPENFYFYLKRCVALPGDTLEVRNKALYINGMMQPLPKHLKFITPNIIPKGYADERIFPPGAQFNEDNYGPLRIPRKGDEVVLTSSNFIQWETLIRREGHKAELKDGNIFIDDKQNSRYIVEDDYYFGMGDNRNDSYDCRYWGFIPGKNIVGTPIIVYWSWDPNIPLYDIFNKIASIKLGRIGTIIN
jgi:signal peptidase I